MKYDMNAGLRERNFSKGIFDKYVSRQIRDEIPTQRIPVDGEVEHKVQMSFQVIFKLFLL